MMDLLSLNHHDASPKNTFGLSKIAFFKTGHTVGSMIQFPAFLKIKSCDRVNS